MDESLPLTKILIHSDYGGYGIFSEEFKQTFEETYHIDFDDLPSYDPYYDKKNKNKYIETRYDPRLIDTFEKLGAMRSTEKISERPLFRSSLKIVEIPTMLLDTFYISEYDGAEWIWCNVSKKYKDVLFDFLFGVINRDNTVQHRLNEITRCEEFLKANNIRFI
jgi:hypothetical protein